MKALKIICGLVCLLLLVAQVWSMSRWNEARSVYDDVRYLRQAGLSFVFLIRPARAAQLAGQVDTRS